MKTSNKILTLSILSILLFAMTGCRGSASKRAATEVLELIEQKGASKAASTIEREASQIERNAAMETEGYNAGRSRTRRPHHSSSDESSYQSQVYSVQCSQCGGSGVVYVLDYYGNIQYDYYGNPAMSKCSNCGGAGSILVSE